MMKELNLSPIPVRVTTPMMMPAVAVASATGRMASDADTAAAMSWRGDIRLDPLSKDRPSTQRIPASDEYITE